MASSHSLEEHGSSSKRPCEYLTLVFSPLSAPLRSRWRNNGLSADFLGDYVTTFLPGNRSPSLGEALHSEIRHAVTYIANELLENAMKYHEKEVEVPIEIHLELTNDHISISVSNGINGVQGQLYKEFVERLQKQDSGELLLRQMEGQFHASESVRSGLGLVTMIHDYGAQLDWEFRRIAHHEDVIAVTTSAILPLSNLAGVQA